MLYLSEEGVEVESLVQAWLAAQSRRNSMSDEKLMRNVSTWMNDLFYRALQFVCICSV